MEEFTPTLERSQPDMAPERKMRRHKRRFTKVVLDWETLESCFQLPLYAAAEKLGMSTTTIKKRCRAFGIKRWPHLEYLKEQRQVDTAPEEGNCTSTQHSPISEAHRRVADTEAQQSSHPPSAELNFVDQLRGVSAETSCSAWTSVAVPVPPRPTDGMFPAVFARLSQLPAALPPQQQASPTVGPASATVPSPTSRLRAQSQQSLAILQTILDLSRAVNMPTSVEHASILPAFPPSAGGSSSLNIPTLLKNKPQAPSFLFESRGGDLEGGKLRLPL